MSLYVDIEKTYGDFALKVSFETEDEVFAILGASGCGKSLTLKCIAGIEKPDRGVIRLDGDVLFDSGRRTDVPAGKRRIGYLFQDHALFPTMTVFENILCGARDKTVAREYVRRFCLEGREGLYPAQLSGGQKQRTALARMLAAGPRYLLLDEPFSGMDGHLKLRLEQELLDAIESCGGRAVFVSHDREEVCRMTERIAVMDGGRIVEIRPKDELFSSPRTLAAIRLTGCENVSRVEKKDGRWYAPDWGMYLKAPSLTGEDAGRYRYAAVRAHDFVAETEPEGTGSEGTGPEENRIGCEILREISEPFYVTVCCRGRKVPGAKETVPEADFPGTGETVLTARFPRAEWEGLRARGIFTGGRLKLYIPEEKLILLER